MGVPQLRTERLLIRPLELGDLGVVHRLLDPDCDCQEGSRPHSEALALRDRWLRWTELSYDELDRLHQPPYGDRAVVLRGSEAVIGAVGYAPCLKAFGQFSTWAGSAGPRRSFRAPEVGLFWSVLPEHRGRGYAAEAARALIDYAFQVMEVARLVASADYSNAASLRVMEKLGMRIERNAFEEPPYLQAIGVLDNRATP